MKPGHFAASFCLAVMVSGCGTRAVIADLEEDKVIVQASGNDFAVIEAEARKGCQIHGREPVSISYSCLDQYCLQSRYLFACKSPKQGSSNAKAQPAQPTQPINNSGHPANASWDGEWFAQAGPWQLYLKIANGAFTGRARHASASPYEVNGQILQDGLVAGRVNGNGGSSWASLSGAFPSVSLVQDGRVQASFELEKKI